MIKLSRRTFNAALGIGALGTAIPGISFAQTTPVRGGTARIVAASEPAMLIELFQNTGNAGVGSRVIEGLLKVSFDRPSNHILRRAGISARMERPTLSTCARASSGMTVNRSPPRTLHSRC